MISLASCTVKIYSPPPRVRTPTDQSPGLSTLVSKKWLGYIDEMEDNNFELHTPRRNYLIHADTAGELKEWMSIVETNLSWLKEKQEFSDPRLTVEHVTIQPDKQGMRTISPIFFSSENSRWIIKFLV